MLSIVLKVPKLNVQAIPPEMIVKQLQSIGFIQNTRIDTARKTISFDYASFRDMDSAVMELKKMGLGCSQEM